MTTHSPCHSVSSISSDYPPVEPCTHARHERILSVTGQEWGKNKEKTLHTWHQYEYFTSLILVVLPKYASAGRYTGGKQL